MKILNLEQRSEEWFSFREGKITGSKAKDYAKPRYIPKDELVRFATSKGYEFKPTLTIPNIRAMMSEAELAELDYSVMINDSIYKLIAEKIAKPINENDYAERLGDRRFSMALRGEILESEALDRVNAELGMEMIPGRVWQADWNDEAVVSPDGEKPETVDGKEIVETAAEIKCLDSWRVVKAFYEQRPPDEYRQQIVQYFAVNENLKQLHFCIYSDVFAAAPAMELQIFTIEREEVEEEVKMARELENNILQLVNQEVQKFIF